MHNMFESDEKADLSRQKTILDKWGGCFGFGAGRKRLLIAFCALSILIMVSIIILLLKSDDTVSILFLYSMPSETIICIFKIEICNDIYTFNFRN